MVPTFFVPSGCRDCKVPRLQGAEIARCRVCKVPSLQGAEFAGAEVSGIHWTTGSILAVVTLT